MTKRQHAVHATANILWKSEQRVGKKMPPPKIEKFAATARFAEDDELKLFSIVLLYPSRQSVEEKIYQETMLHFLAPELVLPRLRVGSVLHITDGVRVIAEATIKSVI